MTIDDHQAQSFDRVRERILAEHAELRRLLHRLLVAARSIVALETMSEIELRGAITAVALKFDQHFWMEEKHLIPLLAAAQATLVVDEHRQQREIVFALLSEATAGVKCGAALADDARWLVDSLMKDIHDEDQFLLGLDGDAAASGAAPRHARHSVAC
jgi:hypothetical protein